MRAPVSLEWRLAGHIPSMSSRAPARRSFAGAHQRGLRVRIERYIDDAVLTFELDRLLYDIEVEAQHEWLRRLMVFDAFCARRDLPGGGHGEGSVR